MTSLDTLQDYIGTVLAPPAPSPAASAPAPAARQTDAPGASAIAAVAAQMVANTPAIAAAARIALAAAEATAQPAAADDADAATTRAPAAPPSARWLCFDLAGQEFALELLKVQEVQRVPPIVPVRGAPSDVLGVINLRGEIVHVVDAGANLGLGPSDPRSEAARVVVLEDGGRRVGLLVAGVSNLMSLTYQAIERCDAVQRAFPCPALLGITRGGRRARDKRGVIVLLDAASFLA